MNLMFDRCVNACAYVSIYNVICHESSLPVLGTCKFPASQDACNSEQYVFAEDTCCDVFQKGNKSIMAAHHWLAMHSCNCAMVCAGCKDRTTSFLSPSRKFRILQNINFCDLLKALISNGGIEE